MFTTAVRQQLIMVAIKLVKKLLWVFRYPSFASIQDGQYIVGALQTRLSKSVACQVHYPAVAGIKSKSNTKFVPYIRPKAIEGLADYSGTPSHVLDFLSQRPHPCLWEAEPIIPLQQQQQKKFPVVIFSHGLGGCLEMYTQLCQQIASYGYIVVAMEHEDGSGAYAEDAFGNPIRYKRPDDSPYSRHKVLTFRKAFLQQRVQETKTVIESIVNYKNDKDNEQVKSSSPLLQTILQSAADTSRIHLVGHSFGGATMILLAQDYLSQKKNDKMGQLASAFPNSIKSLSLLDPWAFSLEDAALDIGIPSSSIPVLNLLSEAWLTNPETAEVDQFLRNCRKWDAPSSWYVPDSVHASFSDAVSWLPRVVGRKLGLRGKAEAKHQTIPVTAQACVQCMMRDNSNQIISMPPPELKPYDYGHDRAVSTATTNGVNGTGQEPRDVNMTTSPLKET